MVDTDQEEALMIYSATVAYLMNFHSESKRAKMALEFAMNLSLQQNEA